MRWPVHEHRLSKIEISLRQACTNWLSSSRDPGAAVSEIQGSTSGRQGQLGEKDLLTGLHYDEGIVEESQQVLHVGCSVPSCALGSPHYA